MHVLWGLLLVLSLRVGDAFVSLARSGAHAVIRAHNDASTWRCASSKDDFASNSNSSGSDNSGNSSRRSNSDERPDDELHATYSDSSSSSDNTEQQQQQLPQPTSPAPETDEDDLPKISGDWRRFRAKLIAGSDSAWYEQLARNRNPQLQGQEAWACELAVPEAGCLLIANPAHFTTIERYYTQAVIFLVQHNQNGTVGFVLNRPTQFKIGSVTTDMSMFKDSPLYWGGSLGQGTVQMIHSCDDTKMPGARKIFEGLYVGGSQLDAQELIARGQARPDDFRFFLQLYGQSPGKLQKEIDAGKWFVAACSTNIVLKPCVQLQVPLWREVLQLLGGKYNLIGRKAFGEL